MRIISGSHKGRRINPPRNLPVRPTTDLARESLFNIITNNFYFDEIKVLDLFAGTGSISYEFASRGAAFVMAVDMNYRCVKYIKETIQLLQMDVVQVRRADAFSFAERCNDKFDIIFADPPYDLESLNKIPEVIFRNDILSEGGWFILEHDSRYSFSSHPSFLQERKYGKVHFTVFS